MSLESIEAEVATHFFFSCSLRFSGLTFCIMFPSRREKRPGRTSFAFFFFFLFSAKVRWQEVKLPPQSPRTEKLVVTFNNHQKNVAAKMTTFNTLQRLG